MEKSSKRGKIPQSDWPLIMARYEAGETLASIARTYDCSPPAISYVVSRSRARQPAPETAAQPPGGPEAQLIKAAPPDGAAVAIAKPAIPGLLAATPAVPNGHDRPDAASLAGRPEAATAPPSHHRDSHPPPGANGFVDNGSGERRAEPTAAIPRPGPPDRSHPADATPPATDGRYGVPPIAVASNGDHRRRLHLSLGQPPQRNGAPHPGDMQPAERPAVAEPNPQPAQPAATAPYNGPEAAALSGLSGIRPPAYPENARRNDGEAAPQKVTGAFIDHELRARVDGDIAAFLAAFDAALANDTQESRSALREATDRLLRAGARTRIELERLEARIPLPPRDNGRPGEAAWRQR